MISPYRFPDDGPIRFRRERDLGDVINASVRFCRETWREWLPALALIAGPLYVIGGALESFAPGWGSVVSASAGLLVAAGAFGYVRLYREGAEAVETADVWDEAKGLFWPTFTFTLCCGGVFLLLMLPVLILAGLAGAGGGVAAAATVGVVGVLVLLAALLVLYPYYLAGQAARLLDEDAFSDAVRRVHGLIREERGFALGTSVVLLFIVGLGTFVIAGMVAGLTFPYALEGSVPLWAGVLTGLASLVVLPFSVFYYVASAFLYESLSARVEGTELGEGIEAIAAATGLGGAGGAARSEPPRPDLAHPEPPRPDDAPADDASPDDGPPGRAGGFRGGGFRAGS
ncbi:hypothetical protein [Rubrivirga litoralis]|uniref:Glycerophosphoryl diester phosphodiesterase membrane domain-containing protein n=1 Tax=Rubrivirga litoralis TaxID=3075598 RepID=A0ABU3BMA3_9BACT|nr:hypothetical protein [Rubrivirga sp. F394]MDT0630412.1 hypothetical protein [Rubrivirga sp. F394]